MTPPTRVTIALVVGAALLSSCATGAAGTPEAAGTTAASALRLEACPVTDPGVPDVADAAPSSPLACFDDSTGTVTLSKLRGRPTVVNLWASWCLPCRREMPMLQAAHADRPDVTFLGVNVSDDRSSAVDLLTKLGITYPQAVDPTNRLPALLDSVGLPVTIVVDATGAMTYRRIGEMSEGDLAAALALTG